MNKHISFFSHLRSEASLGPVKLAKSQALNKLNSSGESHAPTLYLLNCSHVLSLSSSFLLVDIYTIGYNCIILLLIINHG